MSKLTFEYDESGNSVISAFAYNTGHLIEELIKERTNNLIEDNKLLQAKILGFRQKIPKSLKSKYDDYFKIVLIKEENI